MSFSVGVLYSAIEFLQQLQATPIDSRDFKASFLRFSVASAEEVLVVSQQCGWIAINTHGVIHPTDRGLEILEFTDYTIQLRKQLLDMISIYQPTWAKRIPNGRAEARSSFPKDAEQCFHEAGLLNDWDDALIKWWDELAQAAKAKKSSELLEIGRKAERLSFEHELTRTGVKPKWQSLESNFSGYDILSRVSDGNETPLKIEVKGTTLPKKQAYFTITRNEWTTAQSSQYYCLHLWLLNGNPIDVIIIDRDDVAPHLPENKGNGSWETARIPFIAFSN